MSRWSGDEPQVKTFRGVFLRVVEDPESTWRVFGLGSSAPTDTESNLIVPIEFSPVTRHRSDKGVKLILWVSLRTSLLVLYDTIKRPKETEHGVQGRPGPHYQKEVQLGLQFENYVIHPRCPKTSLVSSTDTVGLKVQATVIRQTYSF